MTIQLMLTLFNRMAVMKLKHIIQVHLKKQVSLPYCFFEEAADVKATQNPPTSCYLYERWLVVTDTPSPDKLHEITCAVHKRLILTENLCTNLARCHKSQDLLTPEGALLLHQE